MAGGILGKVRTWSRHLKVSSCSGGGSTGRARFSFPRFRYFVLFLICSIQAGCQEKSFTIDRLDYGGPYCEGPYIEGPYFEGPYFPGLYFDGPYLEGAYFEGPYIDGLYVEGPYFEGPYFDGPYLEGP